MTTAEENLALQANRLQWRDAESEWLRAEDALRGLEECVVRYPDELRDALAETGVRLRLWRDQARERVVELDRAYAAAFEAASRAPDEA